MIWLIVPISINGGLPRVLEKIPYEDMQSCGAGKAVRNSRRDYSVLVDVSSIERKVFCLEEPTARVG
jgi:hypothetical protein